MVLTKLAVTDPGKLATIAYGVLPRDVFVQVQNNAGPGGLDADTWAKMRKVLDLIEQSVPEGTEPGPIFEEIEQALRSSFAKVIAE